MKNFIAILVILFLSMPLSAYAAELNGAQLTELKHIQSTLSVVKDLAQRNIITQEEAAKANAVYGEQSTQILGRAVTLEEINAFLSRSEKSEGFGVFLNTIIVLAGIAFLLSAVGLIAYYLKDFLKTIPIAVYEAAAYVASFVMLGAGYLWKPFQLWFLTIDPSWMVIPGALAFAGCINLSWFRWMKSQESTRSPEEKHQFVYVGPGGIKYPTLLFGSCTLVWGTFAVFYNHIFPNQGLPQILAFIAVIALQVFLGFSIITMPGCIAMGWEDEKKIPRSTVSSLILLTVYVLAKLNGSYISDDMRLFETGCLFMGAFVYFLGLLIMSSKWYSVERKFYDRDKQVKPSYNRYALMQGITIASGLAAFYLGNTFGIGALLGIGGTFFAIYLLEKYYEIPWNGVGWTWSLLGVAVALYFFVGFAGAHPQYFIWSSKDIVRRSEPSRTTQTSDPIPKQGIIRSTSTSEAEHAGNQQDF